MLDDELNEKRRALRASVVIDRVLAAIAGGGCICFTWLAFSGYNPALNGLMAFLGLLTAWALLITAEKSSRKATALTGRIAALRRLKGTPTKEDDQP